MTIAPVLTIAGSDSSGGAGIQADLKTMTMLGCFGMSAITALTAQNTTGVREICPVPAAFLEQQIAAVCEDIPPLAVKIGMVYDIPQIHAIAAAVRKYRLPHVVVDPVMVATSGDALLRHHHRSCGVDGHLSVRFHLRGDLLRFDQQRFHNLVFRHGLNDFALDENLSLAVAGCHTQIGFTGLARTVDDAAHNSHANRRGHIL